MSQQNKTTLQAAINTQLADNTSGDISAADVRDNMINMTDSLVFNEGTGQTITGGLTVTGGITGSFQGTATTASYAATASFVQSAQTASYILNSISSSFASTASFVRTAQTASFVVTAQTASYVLNAVSASHATTASYISPTFISSSAAASGFGSGGGGSIFPYTGSAKITGSLGITGSLTSISGSVFLGYTDGNNNYNINLYRSGVNDILILGANDGSLYMPNIIQMVGITGQTLIRSSYELTLLSSNSNIILESNNVLISSSLDVQNGTVLNGTLRQGQSTQTTGNYSRAYGNSSIASGDYSHAEGNSTEAIGQSSHAEGQFTLTMGTAAHSEGVGTVALGNFSHAEGTFTVASGSSQHVQGRYNTHGDTTSLMIVGNGTNDNARKDAFKVRMSGSIVLPTTSSGQPGWTGTDGEIIAGTAAGGAKVLWVYLGGTWLTSSLGI
jgi:hypothetical protein